MDRELLYYPEEALKKKSRPVESTSEWKGLIKEMEKIMISEEGVGLAAPQVGVNIRLFLMRMDEAGEIYEAYFNPEIIETAGEVTVSESCLSFPGVSIELTRARRLKFRARTPSGEVIEKTVNDLLAQCVQHETEHLNGITLFDNASLMEKMEIDRKLKDFRRKNE
ncbi:MAG: peptide deformylase [bacterium]